jgi:hypothetical protein
MFFFNIFSENFGENLAICSQNMYCYIMAKNNNNISFKQKHPFRRKLAKIDENRRKSTKIDENCRKLPKIAENCRKLPKIAKNNIDQRGRSFDRRTILIKFACGKIMLPLSFNAVVS